MLDRRPVLHTIILQARSAWTCIFSSQLVWISFQGNQIFLCNDDDVHQPAWLEYPFRRVHPILRWLPTELATWIGENFGQELCIPPKRGLEWTAGELNAILESNLVPNHNGKGQLRTFCCIQWECELYSGRPKARCYPFNLSGHCFLGKNSQVFHIT